jgi:hypothetical protein
MPTSVHTSRAKRLPLTSEPGTHPLKGPSTGSTTSYNSLHVWGGTTPTFRNMNLFYLPPIYKRHYPRKRCNPHDLAALLSKRLDALVGPTRLHNPRLRRYFPSMWISLVATASKYDIRIQPCLWGLHRSNVCAGSPRNTPHEETNPQRKVVQDMCSSTVPKTARGDAVLPFGFREGFSGPGQGGNAEAIT